MHGLGHANPSRLPSGLTALNTPSGAVAPDAPALSDGNVLRLSAAVGLAANDITVDAAAGIIRGVSIMSVGPATGHGFDIDAATLDTLITAFNALDDPPRAHFTHGDWDTDPAEIVVGRAHNLRRDGDRVRGDMHVAQYANLSPRGKLRDFLLAVAAEDPGAIGISIVAAFDFERQYDSRGEVERVLARTKFLHAVDFVGDPAANRNGLLSNPSPAHHAAGASVMNPKLRQFLESKGLKKGATDAEAWTHLSKLTGDDRAKADALKTPGANPPAPGSADPAPGSEGDGRGDGATGESGNGNNQRNATGANPLSSGAANPSNNGNGATPLQPLQPLRPAGTDGTHTADHIDRAVQAALARQQQVDRERISALTNLAQRSQASQETLAQWINGGLTVQQATDAALTASLERNAPVDGLSMPRVTGGEDGRTGLATAIEDMILERLNTPLYETDATGAPVPNEQGERTLRRPHERAAVLHNLSLIEVCRTYLRQLGVPVAYEVTGEEAAQLCFNRNALAQHLGGVALAHSTSDFPGIFGNVLNKTLLPAYEEEPSTWEMWAQEYTARDLRQVQFHSVGHVAAPPKVLEGQEYELAYITEKYEVGQVFKYGCLTGITWEMMVNDDLNAFGDQVWGFAMAAHALENDLLYTQLTSNPTMNEDSTALFHSDHGNLNAGSGAAALDQDTLSDMRVAMRLQRGLESKAGAADGRHLNLRPNVLLVPVELETTAEQLVASITQLGQDNPNVPNLPFVRNLNIVSESRLSDDSTTAHYLASTRRPHAPAKVLKLRGHRGPRVERLNTGTSIDGTTWKLRHVAGATFTDWRSIQKNAGS